jgi:hypothetical protein
MDTMKEHRGAGCVAALARPGTATLATVAIAARATVPTGVLAAVLTLGAAVAAIAPAGAAEDVVIDGVRHTRNGDQPSQGTTTLRLQEQWRSGGEGSDILLGLVADVTGDVEGNVYVLDRQLNHVLVYGPSGNLARTLGREGDGPGEFRFPTSLLILPDGRVGVSRVMPGSIVLLGRDGTPAGTIHIGDSGTNGAMQFLDEVLCEGNQLVVSGRSLHRTADGVEREMYAGILDLNGKELARLIEKRGSDPIVSRKYVERDEYWVSSGGMTAGRDGRVYLAQERDRYAISVFSPDGKLERVIEREIQPRKRTAEEKSQVGAGMVAIVNGARVRLEIVAEDYPPCVLGMTAMNNGELWVSSAPVTDERPKGILAAYDVFNAAGAFVRRVELAGPGDPDNDRVVLLGADRLVVIKGAAAAARAASGDGAGEEAEPLEVISYRVVPA